MQEVIEQVRERTRGCVAFEPYKRALKEVRPDLFKDCREGLRMAIRIYMECAEVSQFRVEPEAFRRIA
jgi:hypothetical protein